MPSFLKPKLLIHISQYSSQPDVQILCDSSWGIPDCKPHPELPKEVYHLYEGQNYTFYAYNVTCPDCAVKLIEDHNAEDKVMAASDVAVIDRWQWAEELDVLDSFLASAHIETWDPSTLISVLSITKCTETPSRGAFKARARIQLLAKFIDFDRVERLLASR